VSALKRHVVAVVAALFALAVGIAIGGGPLSYVPDRDDPVTGTDGGDPGDAPTEEPATNGFADAFAAQAAATLYDGRLLGHPTVVLAMPGADQDVVNRMVEQVKAAGGGLTGVFEVGPAATDLGETSLVDTLGSQLVERLETELQDLRVDPTAPTYVRLGQLLGLAIATPVKSGVKKSDAAAMIRTTLAEADLLTSPPEARLAPLVVVVLPPDDPDDEDLLVRASVYRGLTLGLVDNPAGVVVMGDTASGEAGILAQLREDEELATSTSTVDGSETGIGQVTAMLALIQTLDDVVGSYGASGADGAVPLS
jgi:hypothetical protein